MMRFLYFLIFLFLIEFNLIYGNYKSGTPICENPKYIIHKRDYFPIESEYLLLKSLSFKCFCIISASLSLTICTVLVLESFTSAKISNLTEAYLESRFKYSLIPASMKVWLDFPKANILILTFLPAKNPLLSVAS